MCGQAPLHAAAWRCPVWRAPPRSARRCLRTHKQRCAAEQMGLRSGGQAAGQNGASASDPAVHDEQPGEPARASRGDVTAAFPVARPGAGDGGQSASPAAPDRRGSDGIGGGGDSARALSAERRSLGAEASTSGRVAEAGSNGGAGVGSQGASSRRSGRRALSTNLDARGGPGRPAQLPRFRAGADGAARRPPPRVPPGPPQTPMPDAKGRSRSRGPLGWLAGLRARLRGGAAAAPRVDAVPLNFRRGAAAGAAVDPFAPQPAPPAPRPAPDLGTIWGLVVLGIAYVHHSTTGCG
jgi:hypothetical protein